MPSGRWLWNVRSSRCFIKVYSSFTSPLALIEYWLGCTSPSVQDYVRSSFQLPVNLHCIQISNVWGPSWSGSNTPSKMNAKLVFIFCFAVTSCLGWISIFFFFDSALSIVAWVFWGLTFQSGCALLFWFLWEVKINSIKY